MRVLPEAMREALDRGVSHFCYCWQITRHDGVVLGLTDHDRAVTFSNITFLANAGIKLSALDARLGLARQGQEVSGVLGSPHLSSADLQAGLYDEARFRLWLVDWQTPDSRVLMLHGRFGPVSHADGRFRVALHGVGQDLDLLQGRVYQTRCDAVLGDARCRADIANASFRWRGRIEVMQSDSFYVSQLTQAENWFADGLAQFEKDYTLPIKFDKQRSQGRLIQCWQALPKQIAVGQKVTLTAGCDKNLQTCRDKFSNIVNFQGFPFLRDGAILISVQPH